MEQVDGNNAKRSKYNSGFLSALLQVAITAQHMAITDLGLAIFAPGHDMIGMHVRQLAGHAANGALAPPLVIDGFTDILIESPQIQGLLLAAFALGHFHI